MKYLITLLVATVLFVSGCAGLQLKSPFLNKEEEYQVLGATQQFDAERTLGATLVVEKYLRAADDATELTRRTGRVLQFANFLNYFGVEFPDATGSMLNDLFQSAVDASPEVLSENDKLLVAYFASKMRVRFNPEAVLSPEKKRVIMLYVKLLRKVASDASIR